VFLIVIAHATSQAVVPAAPRLHRVAGIPSLFCGQVSFSRAATIAGHGPLRRVWCARTGTNCPARRREKLLQRGTPQPRRFRQREGL